MAWKVNYTDDAERDLQDIFDYIFLVLLEPGIAAKQTNRIMAEADSLAHMPLRYHLYDKEPWRSRGLRVLPVDNYLIFYRSDESRNVVTIVRIMYEGRDIDKQLNNVDE